VTAVAAATSDRPAAATDAPRTPSTDKRWTLAFALLAAAALVVLVYAGRGTSFYFDEWDFVQNRRAWDLDALLVPHNEHLSLVPVLVYKVLFVTAGLEHYAAYRIVGVLFHLLCVAVVFAYVRRRVGDPVALGAAVLLLSLGAGWVDIVWPFQFGFTCSLAAGVGALLALDASSRRGDVVAAVLLGVALASSSLGIPLLAAALVELVGRRQWARWWVVVAPVTVYGLWFVAYRSKGTSAGGGVTADNVLDTPAYVMQAAAGAAGALAGLDPDWGRILVVALIGAVVVAAAVRLPGVWSWRLAALAVAPLSFWALTGLTRASLNEPTAARYLYPGAIFLVLLGAEAARGRRATPPLLMVLGVLALGSLVANAGLLRDGVRSLRDQTTMVQGALAATEAAGDALPDGFAPSPTVAPQVHVGPYREAVEDLGSPAYGPEQLGGTYYAARVAADETLVRGYGLTAAPAAEPGPGRAPEVAAADAIAQDDADGCLLARPEGPGAAITVVVPASGITVVPEDGAASIGMMRWSDTPTPVAGGEAVAGPVALAVPADEDATPWRARIAASAPVTICEGAP